MLKIKELSLKLNNKEILKNISLTLNKGETLSIIGPSGCGKSTLLLTLGGIHENFTGDILSSSKKTSLILQNGGLFPWKTVYENIEFSMINLKISKEEKKKRIEEISNSLNISKLLNKYPNDLSGGERQRVAVSRSLILNPDVLLLDEPSSALDSMNKDNFQNLLMELQKKLNLTFIIVTHNIEEAIFLGKKIAIMSNGEIKSIKDNPLYG
ncbi:MAG: ABC transporter ATP-binding protein, partial [Clostridium sp.]